MLNIFMSEFIIKQHQYKNVMSFNNSLQSLFDKFHQMNNQRVNMSQLTNILFKTVIECCQIMQNTKHIVLQMKDYNDPVTSIDYQIQAKLTMVIQQAYPNLKIIGQENNEIIKEIICSQKTTNHIQKQSTNDLPQGLLELGELQLKDLCVWVDPLDCTRGFIADLKYQCTILVGVTYQGKPFLGIIAQPYKQIKNYQKSYQFNPTVIIGSIKSTQPCAYQYWVNTQSWKIILGNGDNSGHPRIVTSSRRGDGRQDNIIKKMQGQEIKVGGAGHKLLLVIKGEADALLLIGVETSKWDSCAGQAILNAMGGYTIQPDLQQIGYSNCCSHHKNSKGFISTKGTAIFNLIVELLKNDLF